MLNFGILRRRTRYSYVEIGDLDQFLNRKWSSRFCCNRLFFRSGMTLACISLPGLFVCGYIETPQDAPPWTNPMEEMLLPAIRVEFGWQGELNLQYTLDKLFDGEFGLAILNMKQKEKSGSKCLKEFEPFNETKLGKLVEQLPTDNFTKIVAKKDSDECHYK